jgi:ubiquinone/menaquinone biosynthesis C-methylase UbiE
MPSALQTPLPQQVSGIDTAHVLACGEGLTRILGVRYAIICLDYLSRTHVKEAQIDAVRDLMGAMMPGGEVPTHLNIQQALTCITEFTSQDRLQQREFVYRVKYSLIDGVLHRAGVTVMNYGYHDETKQPIRPDQLTESEIPFRYGLQLYQRTLAGIEIHGRNVVEVGSGNGGGARWLQRQYQPLSYTGIDICDTHEPFSSLSITPPPVTFLHGSSSKLPIHDLSADLLFSVEASHAFPSLTLFAQEAYRVLKQDGTLALATFFQPHAEELFLSSIVENGFALERSDDISIQVRAGLERYVPELLKLEQKLQGIEDRELYKWLISARRFDQPGSNWNVGTLKYVVCLFRKQ